MGLPPDHFLVLQFHAVLLRDAPPQTFSGSRLAGPNDVSESSLGALLTFAGVLLDEC